jgi:hypothetical protein
MPSREPSRGDNVIATVMGIIVFAVAILLLWGAYLFLRPTSTPTRPAANLTTTTSPIVTPTTQNPSGGPLQPPPCAFQGGHDNC